MLLQVARRRAQEAPVRQHAARGQPFIGQRAEADGEVVAVFHEVDRAVRHVKLHLDLRMTLAERRHNGRDGRTAEPEARVHAQQTARRGAVARDRVFHVADRRQDARRMREIGLALARQRQPPRRAVDEAHAQPCLHLRQALRGGRRREVERAGGRGQRAVARDQHEEFEFGSAVSIHRDSIINSHEANYRDDLRNYPARLDNTPARPP